jgi:exopolyphosphatase/guanosine-5'-triphosphate,3'-diphosphate pyrophosphatase
MPAAIDLGSNSVLLTVLDADGTVKHDEARVVGLGKGLGDGGAFADDRMDAALDALSDYAQVAAGLGVDPADVQVVATSAARRATNADAFIARVAEQTGLKIRVISGDEEARLTWAGALSGLETSGTVLVVDLGGGSTELALGEADLRWRHSYEVGSVRLTERIFGDTLIPARPQDLLAMQMRVATVLSEPLLPDTPTTVIGVAGSVTTLMATALELTTYDGAQVHGAQLTDAMLEGFQQRLIGLDAHSRRALFATAPKRADYLLAGATVLRGVLSVCHADAMVVSDRGLRYGVLES